MSKFNNKSVVLKEARFVGVDLAKKIFGVVVTDKNKKVLLQKMVKPSDFINFLDQISPDKQIEIFVEGCGMSQFWARELRALGFNISIVPAQYVKPFVQMGKKNDLNDAIAIVEASQKDGVHFVCVKNALQRDLCLLVNRRDQLVDDKIRLQNRLHALFRENGHSLNEKKTTTTFIREARLALEVAKITITISSIIEEMLEELTALKEKIDTATTKIERVLAEIQKQDSTDSEVIKNMLSVYGVGPITVATIIANYGDLKQFKSGRTFSAFLGLTPRQFSSGGKQRLGSITKAGNSQIRSLLTLCAHSFLIRLDRLDKESALVKWLKAKSQTMSKKKLVVALANKLARILWAVSTKNDSFRFA